MNAQAWHLIAPFPGLINLQDVALQIADKRHPTVRHFQDFVNDLNAPSPEGLDEVMNSRLIEEFSGQ